MALRDKLRDRAQPYLEPGEQIHAVALTQTGPTPWLGALSFLFILFGAKHYIVVFTDRSIVVLQASVWVPTKPKTFVGRLPREVRVGDISGLWGKAYFLGEKSHVHKRFHKDLQEADAALAAQGRLPATTVQAGAVPAQPAGWYPDPSGTGQRYWDGVNWTDQTQ